MQRRSWENGQKKKNNKKGKKKLRVNCQGCFFYKLERRAFALWHDCGHYKPDGWKVSRDGCPKKKANLQKFKSRKKGGKGECGNE